MKRSTCLRCLAQPQQLSVGTMVYFLDLTPEQEAQKIEVVNS